MNIVKFAVQQQIEKTCDKYGLMLGMHEKYHGVTINVSNSNETNKIHEDPFYNDGVTFNGENLFNMYVNTLDDYDIRYKLETYNGLTYAFFYDKQDAANAGIILAGLSWAFELEKGTFVVKQELKR